jgi:hypothetical protein
MLRKTLWVAFSFDPDDLIQKATYIGAAAVAIRTVNPITGALITKCHKAGLKVYGWLFPAIVPKPPTGRYADDEAQHVANDLIPAGLDGYFADPEGTSKGDPRNWDQPGLDNLASNFCNTILGAVPAGRTFQFGLTSHYRARHVYPDLPWKSFLSSCDILVPQSYWLFRDEDGQIKPEGNGPAANYRDGMAEWGRLGGRGKIIPMAGELGVVAEDELNIYAQTAAGRALSVALTDEIQTDLYYYTDDLTIPQDNLDSIRNLGKAGS